MKRRLTADLRGSKKCHVPPSACSKASESALTKRWSFELDHALANAFRSHVKSAVTKSRCIGPVGMERLTSSILSEIGIADSATQHDDVAIS